jgi:hypothetical protein
MYVVFLRSSFLLMYTVTYYKFGNRWFIDLPEYVEQGGDAEDLERIGAFHDFLELAAAGETTVIFQMDVQPFEGAEVAELTGTSGGNTGGYYHLSYLEGKPVDVELWFNTILYVDQTELPEKIYFKKMALPRSS